MKQYDENNKIVDSFFRSIVANDSTFRAVGYGSKQSQDIRFKVLTEIGDMSGKTILDVGCGIGGMYEFLTREYAITNYVGIDLVEEMIDKAKLLYTDGDFRHVDLLTDTFTEQFDYVFASGVFSLESPLWWDVVCAMMEKMYGLCGLGLGINFLSAWATSTPNPLSRYVNPSRMLDVIADKLTSKVILRHDYKDNDFSLYLYRD